MFCFSDGLSIVIKSYHDLLSLPRINLDSSLRHRKTPCTIDFSDSSIQPFHSYTKLRMAEYYHVLTISGMSSTRKPFQFLHLWNMYLLSRQGSNDIFFFFIYFYQLEANYFTILQWFLPYIDMNLLDETFLDHPRKAQGPSAL